MKRIGMFVLLLGMSCFASAGMNGYTNHSRANCTNNESISWDWTNYWWLMTRSDHYSLYSDQLKHIVQTERELTWRSAAVHWGEGGQGWKVHGFHWRHYTDGTYHLEAEEWITDCSIYNGWWDLKK
jgi:hypothetical protein